MADPRWHRGVLAVLLASIAALLPAGCRVPDATIAPLLADRSRITPIYSGRVWDDGLATALDIENESGDIIVRVIPNLTGPRVEATVRWRDGESVDLRGLPPGRVDVAIAEDAPGFGVLVVRSRLNEGLPEGATTLLVVEVPACFGVAVRNSGGAVVLNGVSGAITVENGVLNRPGGRIEVRAGDPLVDPVALVTTEGRVTLLMPPGGRAALDLASEDADAIFNADSGSVEGARITHNTYTGTWNGGTNTVMLRTGSGRVRVQVEENPTGYSVMDGTRALFGG